MIVISHRGYWLQSIEKNTREAFERSFFSGFGTETDLRDYCGRLVISHDVPIEEQNLMSFDDFLIMAKKVNQPLAINVKSDGLAALLHAAMIHHQIRDWFVFDMSIPDMWHHLNMGNPTFARMSEVERNPAWLDRCAGVWLDSFESMWFTREIIDNLLSQGKRVCVVSPELHGRAHLPLWEKIKTWASAKNIILCTDFPSEAKAFFKDLM